MIDQHLAIMAPCVPPEQYPLRQRLYNARVAAGHKLNIEADDFVRSICRIISIIVTEDLYRPMPDDELQIEVDLCMRAIILANALQRRANRENRRLYGAPDDA